MYSMPRRVCLLCFVSLWRFCVGWAPLLVKRRRATALDAVSVSEINPNLSILQESSNEKCCWNSKGVFEDYTLSVVEDEDLFDLALFVVTAFGADAIRLSQDMNAFERMLLQPAVEFANSYSGSIALAEVFAGVQSRTNLRRQQRLGLDAPDLIKVPGDKDQQRIASQTSLILVVARPGSQSSLDICASVELRLEPCDAKIPFTLPFLDVLERKLASWIGISRRTKRLQPYLSNLCVDEAFRGRGLGKSLVNAAEAIAFDDWGYKKVYLHVDKDNAAALGLYESAGYCDVGKRWTPPWAGKAADIGYYVKKR